MESLWHGDSVLICHKARFLIWNLNVHSTGSCMVLLYRVIKSACTGECYHHRCETLSGQYMLNWVSKL